jgi:hypothetical protein
MRRLKRRLTASLAGELKEASIKALSELAIAYAWLEDCRSRAIPLANFSALQKSFELWWAFIIRECEEMSYAQSAPPSCKHRLARVTTQPRKATSTDTPTRRMRNGANTGT